MPEQKVKKTNIWWKIATIIAVLLVLYQGGAVIAFSFIFPRYTPSLDGYCRKYTEAEAETIPREDFSFPSGDNMLTARFYPANNAKATMIIAHGYHSYGDRFFELAAYFSQRNYNVITYNATGTYDSEGNGTIGLSQMRSDLLACIKYVNSSKYSSYGSVPLILLGHSLGGYSVCTALRDAENVSAAIAVAPFDEPIPVMKNYAAEYVGAFADITFPAMYLQNFFVFGADHNLRASDVLNSTLVPTMVVYGSNDTIVTPDLSVYQYKDNIHNPLVSFMYIEEEYRNTHTSIWYTQESAKTLLEREKDAASDGTYPALDPDSCL